MEFRQEAVMYCPDDAPKPFDPHLGLVVILETNNAIHLSLAAGLLKEAGIPYYILGKIATLIQDVDPFLHKWEKLQVPRDREAEARELLQQLEAPVEDVEARE
jgi:hypothetical protein